MKKNLLLVTTLLGITSCSTQPPSADIKPAFRYANGLNLDRHKTESVGKKFAISTQGIYSTRAAKHMFELGGNIIDASVAASFALAVERPQSTGIGGGGFLIYREQKTGKTYAVDFRERAPIASTENMFLNPKGEVQSQLSKDGILATAIPGMVAGLIEIHEKFGALPLKVVLQPAIDLAQNGFPIYKNLFIAIKERAPVLLKDPSARTLFFDKNRDPKAIGQILTQPALAESLKLISIKGRDGFYKGTIAKSFTEYSKKNGGIIQQRDLDEYKVRWREAVHSPYKGYDVYSMPPPSSGGVHVIQFLNILEKDNLAEKGAQTAASVHLAASALQVNFADRAKFLGDSDFNFVPTQGLISKEYAAKRRGEFLPLRARMASEVAAGNPLPYESQETTHFSIMDEEGNAVASTQTINGWMGAGVIIPGTGIVLNNEMDDFSAKVGDSNLFGAIGGKPNSIAPKKTPLSSMSPTILIRDNKAVLSLGAPGGTRIISCVAQTILNYVEFKMSLYDAIAGVRYHHQWKPDVLELEPPGLSHAEKNRLEKMGYNIKENPIGCFVMAVAREGENLRAVADPRDIGTSAAQ